jgi:type II secretory pathway pseudopilin PulG
MMRSHRGSALLAALIVIGVLSLVTVATLRLASISKTQSVRDARLLSQASCVDAARQYLLSRLTLTGPGLVTDITFNNAVHLDTGDRQIYTGHVRPKGADGRPIGTPVITKAHGVLAKQVSGTRGSQDTSNRIGSSSRGNNYHVVVACSDPVAGDMELEFTFRYGL